MAITFINKPEELAPAYNPMYWVVDSDNKALAGFRYVFEIYNDVTNDLLATLQIAPDVDNGYGYADISRIINSNVSYDLDTTADVIECPNCFVPYRIDFKETYLYSWDFNSISFSPGDSFFTLNGSTAPLYDTNDQVRITITSGETEADGLSTVDLVSGSDVVIVGEYLGTSGVATGTVYFANNTKFTSSVLFQYNGQFGFNGARSFADFPSYVTTDYYISNTANTTHRLLTDIPDGFYCTPDQDLWLNFFVDPSNLNDLRYRVTTSDGDIFYDIAWSNSGGSPSIPDELLKSFAAGPGNLNPTNITVGSFPVIKDTTTWYKIRMASSSANQTSREYLINIDRRCKIEDYEILFMDRMGSFCSYSFQLRSKETGTVDRKSYNKFLGTVGASGWSYQTTDAGNTVYNVNVQKQLELNTNWMNDDMSVYFEQLLTSPLTYIKDTDGLYYPVVVQDSGFETHRQRNKVLIRKTVMVAFANLNPINI